MKKNQNLAILILALILFTCCSSNKKTYIVWLDAHPTDCFGEGVKNCIPIYYGELEPEKYTETLTDSIQGFTYNEGFVYKLKVKEIKSPDSKGTHLRLEEQLVKQKLEEKRRYAYFRGKAFYKSNVPVFSDCITNSEYPILFGGNYQELQRLYHELLVKLSNRTPILLEFEGYLNIDKQNPNNKTYMMANFIHVSSLELCQTGKITDKVYISQNDGEMVVVKLNDNYTMQVLNSQNKEEVIEKEGTWQRENWNAFGLYFTCFDKNRYKNSYIKIVYDFKEASFRVVKTDIEKLYNRTFIESGQEYSKSIN